MSVHDRGVKRSGCDGAQKGSPKRQKQQSANLSVSASIAASSVHFNGIPDRNLTVTADGRDSSGSSKQQLRLAAQRAHALAILQQQLLPHTPPNRIEGDVGVSAQIPDHGSSSCISAASSIRFVTASATAGQGHTMPVSSPYTDYGDEQSHTSEVVGSSKSPQSEETTTKRPRAVCAAWRIEIPCAPNHPEPALRPSAADVATDEARCSELNFARVNHSASLWSLQQHIRKQVDLFNATMDPAALATFTRERETYMRQLIEHLNVFWAVITRMPRVLVAELSSICPAASTKPTGEQAVSVLLSDSCTDPLSVQNVNDHSAEPSTAKQSVIVLRQRACFKDAYENRSISLWTFHESRSIIGISTVSVVELWLKSQWRRTCGAVTFRPYGSTTNSQLTAGPVGAGNLDFNLFRGFHIPSTISSTSVAVAAATTLELNTVASPPAAMEELVKPFLHHLKDVWCRGDDASFRYCVSWMASILQQPWKKTGVAIVLQGEQGSGKGIIVTEFLAKIVGQHHYSHVTGLEQVCGQFNAPALATACLVFVDEAGHRAAAASHVQHAAKLKALITESHHTVTDKHLPAMTMQSFANFIISSNDEHVVAVEPKDRRYFALHTANRLCGARDVSKNEYIQRLLAVPVHMVARYLYGVNISSFDARAIPTTELQRTQKLLTMKPNGVDSWLLRCIESGGLPAAALSHKNPDGTDEGHGNDSHAWAAPRPKSAVYDHYRTHAGSRPMPVETFWRRLHEIIPCRTTQKRVAREASDSGAGKAMSVQMVQFPSLQECKRAFQQHMADDDWTFMSDGLDALPMDSDSPDQNGTSDSSEESDAAAARLREIECRRRWDEGMAEIRAEYC